MKSFRFFLLSIIIAFAICNIEINFPENQDEYFTLLWKKEHILVGYYNSTQSPNYKTHFQSIFNSLSQSHLLHKWDFILMLADVSKIPMLYNHYSMTSLPNLYYFIRRQLLKCEDFSTEFDKSILHQTPEKISQFSEDFVHGKISEISKEINSLEQLNYLLDESKILGVFLGQKNEHYDLFEKWAAKNFNFDFYHSFSIELKELLFVDKRATLPTKTPLFAIIRSDDLLTALDDQKIVYSTDFNSENSLSMFFDFERYPKLMDDSWGNNITHLLFFKDEKLLLYIDSENSDRDDFNIFERAVAVLPKKFVFSFVDIASRQIAAYMQLFMLGKISMQPGKVYIIKVLPSRTVDIQEMRENLTVNSILKFAGEYMHRHADYFEIKRKQEEGIGEDEVEEQEEPAQEIEGDL